jgi:hypothetical protein
MLVHDPEAFLAAFAQFEPVAPATARAAFLVSPADFRLAAESARDNRYMDLARIPDPARALAEHAALAACLREDVPVITFPGDPDCPDGVFPNNVFATAPGRFVVGRMRHAVRRREALRSDVRGFFRDLLGYCEIDLSDEDFVAELTGSLVIDRARGVGFCGLSERCDLAGAQAMHEAFGCASRSVSSSPTASITPMSSWPCSRAACRCSPRTAFANPRYRPRLRAHTAMWRGSTRRRSATMRATRSASRRTACG